MLLKKAGALLKENKVAVLLALVIIALIIYAAPRIGSLQKGVQSSVDMANPADSSSMLRESAAYKTAGLGAGSDFVQNTALQTSSGSYVEVKEGSMTINTKDAEGDSTAIRSLTEGFGGYVEDMRKYDSEYSMSIYLRARVPEEKFQSFADALKGKYDEKDFTLSFYRVSTQNEINELSIINTAFNNYAELRNRTMRISLDENQINLLLKITQNELELKRLEKQYASSLSDKQARSEYSTINIALEEKKKVKIMPENLGNQLRLKAKNALSETANSLIDIITGSISVFISAVKYVIYIILLAIPLIIGYRILVRIYNAIAGKA